MSDVLWTLALLISTVAFVIAVTVAIATLICGVIEALLRRFCGPLAKRWGLIEDLSAWDQIVDRLVEEQDLLPFDQPEEEPVAREPLKRADEYDAISWLRRFRFTRAGEVSEIKRRIRRRERHVGKHRLRKGDA